METWRGIRRTPGAPDWRWWPAPQEKEELLAILGQGLDVVIATFVSAGSDPRLERIAQGILMDGRVHPGAYPPRMIRKLMNDI